MEEEVEVLCSSNSSNIVLLAPTITNHVMNEATLNRLLLETISRPNAIPYFS